MDKSCNIIWNSFQHFDRIVRQFIITLLISAAFNEGLERDLIKNQQSREIIFFFIRASAYNRKNYRLFRGLLSALGANIRAYFCEFCLNIEVINGAGRGRRRSARGPEGEGFQTKIPALPRMMRPRRWNVWRWALGFAFASSGPTKKSLLRLALNGSKLEP